ncbi:alpha-galactosidase [Affinibrenneria salicis]|uniref:Alpha-galactosidase n=1 Tax=Affinibrenneria salicis TaxID=2590031 RepID=A0A5J5FZT5_9GAMM|nr:alpha-galactosidase [Affinibrenneria salicis]KAA8999483.1 alpha-galactosidase [Affinibrenneria salicis]
MDSTIHRLSGEDTDLIVRVSPFGEILYWGKPLAGFTAEQCVGLQRAVPNARLDSDAPLTLMAESGRGLFGSPGLEGNRDGEDWSPVFATRSVESAPARLSIVAQDDVAGLRLTSELLLHGDVVQLRHTLTNLKAAPWRVDRLAVTLPLPDSACELMAFHGRWIREFQPHRIDLRHGGYQQENRRGRTSHEYFPAFIAGRPGFSEQQGEVYGVHLAWSGNHRLRADVKSDGRRYLQAEALYHSGEIVLQKDASLSTPWVYASFSDRGLNGMSRHFHRFLRREVLAFNASRPRPVHLNTWEGIFFEHQPEAIMRMASAAADIGVERFIIDDGWFQNRNDDSAALGDWTVDSAKYPDGLQPVIQHVKSLGMEFGLWLEPEMVNIDSQLYRRHPEWLLALPGYQQPAGRNEYTLDLCNRAVWDYLYQTIDRLLSDYAIDYIKWDMNREIVQPAHQGRAAITAQTHAFYRLLDALRAAHPQVEIESCASGGGRIDYEVLKRTHRFWTSDSNDALDRHQIQRGFSYFFPPEVMGAHIGVPHCHNTSRYHTAAFRSLTALFGHMGLELDPLQESAPTLAAYRRYIDLHKQLRALLHSGDLYRIDADDESARMITGVVSQDRNDAVYLIAQLTLPTYALPGQLRFDGLLPDGRYRVEVLDIPDNVLPHNSMHSMKALPAWMDGQPQVFSGDWLANVGLAAPVLDPQSAMLIRFTRLSAGAA